MAGLVTTKRARVGALVAPAGHPFRLGDNPAPAAPTVVRCPHEVLIVPRRPATGLGPRQFRLRFSHQPRVAGQTERHRCSIAEAWPPADADRKRCRAEDSSNSHGSRKKPPFLIAMKRIVGRVQIKDDLRRCRAVRLKKQRHKQSLNRRGVMVDLVIARRNGRTRFQTVQHRLARYRRAIAPLRRKLARQYRHHRIVTQMVVIVQVLIAQRAIPTTCCPTNVFTSCSIRPAARLSSKQSEKRSIRPIALSVDPGNNAPASDVARPASNEASTRRLSTGAKANKSVLQSVGIGELLCSQVTPCSKRIISDSEPRCT